MNAVTNNIEELRASIPATTTTNVTSVMPGPVTVPAPSTLTASPLAPGGATATGLFDLRSLSHDPASELLRDRFLCRHGSLLIVGNTGIGKSSLTTQMMMKWALGEGCFGITPTRPLKSLIIQGENDEQDLSEMRDGVSRSLELSPDQTTSINANVLICHENGTVAESFVEEIVEPLVQRHQPDLVWIDPVFQYLGGDANQQEVVGRFLRQNIGPLLKRHDCAVVFVHHTAKPSKATKPNTNPLLRAYDAAGSAEFSNWPRAVLSLQSTNAADTYRLVAAKRGGRLGWRMPDGITRSYEKMLRHSREPGTIFWQEAVVAGVAANNGQTANPTAPANGRDAVVDAVLANVPAEGIDKQQLIRQVNQQAGTGVNLLRDTITALVVRAGKKPACYVQRVQPPAP
jgi:hypothetical protein